MVDTETAKNLELVGNMTRKKSSHSLFGRVHSSVSLLWRIYLVHSTLDYTYTPMAGRLLRVNLLAPITGHGLVSCLAII
jgi:DNA mismatch repair protein MSH4